jgi:phage tail sheath protein FI
MKIFFITLLQAISVVAVAQKNTPLVKDTFQLRPIVKKIMPVKNVPATNTTINQIKLELDKLVATYSKLQNTAATWALLKADAEQVLLRYFYKGYLAGTKPAQAFFVKIGPETMTAADIAAHKMVLEYGIAIIKPAEYETGKIVKICTN